MFKLKILTAFVLMALATHISGAAVQELESVGLMPEITVTAPRYEYQDEAWAGMIEGVTVEAYRSSINGTSVSTTEAEARINIRIISLDSDGSSYVLLSLVLTLVLVPISLTYMSLGAYLAAKEVNSDRTSD